MLYFYCLSAELGDGRFERCLGLEKRGIVVSFPLTGGLDWWVGVLRVASHLQYPAFKSPNHESEPPIGPELEQGPLSQCMFGGFAAP